MNREEIKQEELLYNQLYEKTKDFGRAQFIKEIMRLTRENKQLKQQLEDNKKRFEKIIEYCDKEYNAYNQNDFDHIRDIAKDI